MTLGTAKTRLLQRLDEDSSSPVFYQTQELTAALNAAQRFFCFITLILQKQVSFALTANEWQYHMLSSYTDWIAPLDVRVSGGGKVAPARIEDIAAANPDWRGATGTPTRYAHLGFDFLALDKHPTASGTTLLITYAHGPAALLLDAGNLEIPEERQPALIDFAIPLLRAKEGGQEFAKTQRYVDRFLEEATETAAFVRARNLSHRYDKLPFELERFDRSLLMLAARG